MATKSRGAPARETDLYAPIRDYLVAQGYTVRGEVNHCDVIARKGDDLIVIEMKRQFGIELLIQATQRQRISDSVYVAIPRPDRFGPRWRGTKRLLRQLELGLIVVTLGRKVPRVEVLFHPMAYRRQKAKRARRAVITEMDRRTGDYNHGGSHGQKLVTAYRENAIHIACCLERFGPLAPRRLRALDTGPRTLSILSRNVYGWFERVAVGVYAITTSGRAALNDFPDLASEYRARIPDDVEAPTVAPKRKKRPQRSRNRSLSADDADER